MLIRANKHIRKALCEQLQNTMLAVHADRDTLRDIKISFGALLKCSHTL